ncbi:hypothetical protein J6590_072428 [Homalodisca vitripennis]|nr:hypothetical protein J6590_072428 [Homalodisca vitripennis]
MWGADRQEGGRLIILYDNKWCCAIDRKLSRMAYITFLQGRTDSPRRHVETLFLCLIH